MRRLGLVMTGVALGAFASPAAAGTIQGTITVSGGGGLSGMQVRAWSESGKSWSIQAITTSTGDGSYSMVVPDGDYKVDARMPPGVNGNYGDRWYDQAAPDGNGYVAAEADVISVSGTVSGIDIALQVLGGADGRVLRPGSTAHPGAIVRMERRSDPRVHHNDITDGSPHAGWFFFRGLPPASDYQIMIYDPAGSYATRRLGGPYTISSNNVGALGNLSISATPSDPYEGNDSANCSAPIAIAPLRQSPPQPFATSGAILAPRGSDPDWHCVQAVAGDRFYVSATTEFSFGGATRYDPWTDPVLAFWEGQGATKIAEDDDSGTGPLDPMVDSGPLEAGCYCISVSAFGDTDYNGTGAGSSGAYRLEIEMGNRPPVVSIRKGTTEVPAAPAVLTINEGETLALNLSYGDADGDSVTPTFTHTDNSGGAVAGGTLNMGASSGDYTWDVPIGATTASPFTITLESVEVEFTMSKTIIVEVAAVNDPPDVPVPVSPIGGAVVSAGTPDLVWSNSTDPEGDSLTYDLEVYYDDTGGAPGESANVAEGSGGQTSFAVAAISENTRVYWRVRARDSGDAVSQWSAFESFLVDSENDPPETPILTKPSNFELLTVRRPGLSVINVEDPEDDPIEFTFEVATDMDFGDVVWTSDPVPMNDVSATTMAVVTEDLAWGGEYFARAKAVDARGAESEWSNVRQFSLKMNVPPTAPTWDGGCQILTYDFMPPEAIVVNNVEDVEGETVTFELEFYWVEDDPDAVDPVLRVTAEMDESSATTAIPFDVAELENGHYRYRVRATDGTDVTEWIHCEMILELSGDPSGGCCRTSEGDVPVAPIALGLAVMLITCRRRRC